MIVHIAHGAAIGCELWIVTAAGAGLCYGDPQTALQRVKEERSVGVEQQVLRVRCPQVARLTITAAVVLILFAGSTRVHATDLFLGHKYACLARLSIGRHQVPIVVQVGHAQAIRRPRHPTRRIGSEAGIVKDCGDGERLRLCLERGHRRDKDAENESTQTGTGGHEGKLRQAKWVLAGE